MVPTLGGRSSKVKVSASPMNSGPALSNVSEIGLISGAPGTMGAGFATPVRFPLPSPYNSIILPPVVGASPTKRFPCASRASAAGALSTYGAVKATVLAPSPGKKGARATILLLAVAAMKIVPLLEIARAWGPEYPMPAVCCASKTIDGACAQDLEAQKARARIVKQSNFHFGTKYLARVTDM